MTPCGRQHLWILLLLSAVFSGCAGVKSLSLSTSDYMSVRRGDVLTTGTLSSASVAALQVVGLDTKQCAAQLKQCEVRLMNDSGLETEQRTATLAELWLQHALRSKNKLDIHAEQLNAWLQASRYAYAYLFFSERPATERALEDRQTQVRDYYNYAVQQAVMALFAKQQHTFAEHLEGEGNFFVQSGLWLIYGQLGKVKLTRNQYLPNELIPASSLTFEGVRNQYRRDGLGAELVAVMARKVVRSSSSRHSFSETPFPALTVTLTFPGNSLDAVLSTHEVKLAGYDPYRVNQVTMAGQSVPLAANFTSGYGLWLARSGFAKQSLLTLVGRGEILEQPHIYMMQPYDPNRRILVLLHGLASSPEAWINMANEILGDETLRQNYQIWQVYYPTNAPIALNHAQIRETLLETLQQFDPKQQHFASQNLVLVGHSMGGVLARLMVSASGDTLWQEIVERYQLNEKRQQRARKALQPYVWFDPMPQVRRAVFIAAPHQGTPMAEQRLARWSASLIKLPFSMLGRITEIAQLLVDPSSAQAASMLRGFNSIDNLSDQDPFIRVTAHLPIAANVPYHSIIGQEQPNIPLWQSSDGVVPYQSAHLTGASSELVVHSWHSVQKTPAAILEIRRILHEHLNES